jgi:glutamate/tyrosine decarboxylase-like PLP-dependent enzyme
MCSQQHEAVSNSNRTKGKPSEKELATSWQNDAHSASEAIHQVAEIFRDINLELGNDHVLKMATAEKTSDLKKYAAPGAAHSIEEVLKEASEIFDYRMRMNHPRSFAFIPSPVSPFSWLGETVTSAFNAFAGSRLQSSGPSAIESELIRWMAAKAGLPPTAGGLSVSGGSMANLTAMVLARDQKLSPDNWSSGTAYVSDQTHSSVAKGLRILGFRESQVRKVPTDDQFRMDISALKKTIQSDREDGYFPFVIIASCGTTNTGSIDPLSDIVEMARKEGLWVHVDGAYGASALLSKSNSSLLDGLEGVDSISWDAHKWLFQTYGCGMLLVRDKAHLAQSFHTDAEYIKDAAENEDVPNFWNLGIELTRPARIMKLWFTLRVLGLEKIGQLIDHGFELAEIAQKELDLLPDWEVTSPANMAILTFRLAPSGKSEDEIVVLNRAISQQAVSENVAGILTTKLNGKTVLRICAISPLMTGCGMKTIIGQLDSIGRNILHGHVA